MGWRLGLIKLSYAKKTESDFFFIKNPNVTKNKNKFWRRGGEGRGCGCG